MARNFDGASRIVLANTVTSSSSWTIASRIKYTSVGSNYQRILGQASFNIELAVKGLDNSRTIEVYDGTDWRVLGSAISLDTWYSLVVVYTSGVGLEAFLDGSSWGTSAGGRALSGASTIGDYHGHTGSTDGNQWIGDLAELAIWDGTLTPGQIASLGTSYAPVSVPKPKHYWPLIGRHGPEIELFGANNGTVTSATAADHPRIIYPSKQRVIVAAVTPPPAAAGFRSRVAGGFAIG